MAIETMENSSDILVAYYEHILDQNRSMPCGHRLSYRSDRLLIRFTHMALNFVLPRNVFAVKTPDTISG